MPARDRTGPMGLGPLTGRGFGPCGRGFAFRRGFGRYWQFPALTKQEEKRILEQELKEIEAEKKEIEKRLKELKE